MDGGGGARTEASGEARSASAVRAPRLRDESERVPSSCPGEWLRPRGRAGHCRGLHRGAACHPAEERLTLCRGVRLGASVDPRRSLWPIPVRSPAPCQPPPHRTSPHPPPGRVGRPAAPAAPAIHILLLHAAERPSLAAPGLVFSSFVPTPVTAARCEDLALGGQLLPVWNKLCVLFQETQRKLCPRLCVCVCVRCERRVRVCT